MQERTIVWKKALIQGGILAGYQAFVGKGGSIPVASVGELPLWLVSGTAGALSGLAGDTAQKYITPAIGGKETFQRMESGILSVMVHTATYGGLLFVFAPGLIENQGLFRIIVEASGSDMAAHWAADMLGY